MSGLFVGRWPLTCEESVRRTPDHGRVGDEDDHGGPVNHFPGIRPKSGARRRPMGNDRQPGRVILWPVSRPVADLREVCDVGPRGQTEGGNGRPRAVRRTSGAAPEESKARRQPLPSMTALLLTDQAEALPSRQARHRARYPTDPIGRPDRPAQTQKPGDWDSYPPYDLCAHQKFSTFSPARWDVQYRKGHGGFRWNSGPCTHLSIPSLPSKQALPSHS